MGLFFFNNDEILGFPEEGEFSGIFFDTVISESFYRNVEVTQKKTQQGFDITTGISPKNPKISFVALVSNYSLRNSDNSNNVALDAYNAINLLMDKRISIKYVSAFQIFENVVISSVSTARTVDIGNALEFTIELEIIDIVQTQTITLELNIKPKSLKTKDGRKTAKRKVEPLNRKTLIERGLLKIGPLRN